MADYRKMYAELFNEISALIERMQKIQQKVEEMYIESTGEKTI